MENEICKEKQIVYNNICKIRNEKKLSRSQLAKISGVSKTTLEKIENVPDYIFGVRVITVLRIALALDVKVSDLVKFSTDKLVERNNEFKALHRQNFTPEQFNKRYKAMFYKWKIREQVTGEEYDYLMSELKKAFYSAKDSVEAELIIRKIAWEYCPKKTACVTAVEIFNRERWIQNVSLEQIVYCTQQKNKRNNDCYYSKNRFEKMSLYEMVQLCTILNLTIEDLFKGGVSYK